MIVGLHGYPRCGKNAVADILVREHGFVVVSIADHIRRRAIEEDHRYADGSRYSQLVAEIGYDDLKDHPVHGPETRTFLQDLALNERRSRGEDVYVRVAAAKAAQLRAERPGVHIAVPDVRYPSDAGWVRSEPGLSQILRIERPGIIDTTGHVAEQPLPPGSIDQTLHNDGDLDHLSDIVSTWLDILRRDTLDTMRGVSPRAA